MFWQHVRPFAAASLLACLAATPAAAQERPRFGWAQELAGACWQGRDDNGAAVDRHCYQMQFGRFLRGVIERGALRGDSVLGWSRERQRLEMYAWANQGEPAVFTPLLDNNALIFDGAEENGAATRAVWRRDDQGFIVVDQIRADGAWTDRRVTTYRRDGDAPAAFSAGSAVALGSGGGWGWLDRLAGRCFRQVEPLRNADNRGCFAWQYPSVLRQTWYWGAEQTGETVMFRAPDSRDLRYYYWDAHGNFGVGRSIWSRNLLISVADSDESRRRILERRGRGFEITTEVLEPPPGALWVLDNRYRFAPQ